MSDYAYRLDFSVTVDRYCYVKRHDKNLPDEKLDRSVEEISSELLASIWLPAGVL
jgi:hypothetical protein